MPPFFTDKSCLCLLSLSVALLPFSSWPKALLVSSSFPLHVISSLLQVVLLLIFSSIHPFTILSLALKPSFAFLELLSPLLLIFIFLLLALSSSALLIIASFLIPPCVLDLLFRVVSVSPVISLLQLVFHFHPRQSLT